LTTPVVYEFIFVTIAIIITTMSIIIVVIAIIITTTMAIIIVVVIIVVIIIVRVTKNTKNTITVLPIIVERSSRR
jgi:hypothetical protein